MDTGTITPLLKRLAASGMVIGSGNIGATLARKLVANGDDVRLANSRGPESIRDLARDLGATAVSKEQAVRDVDLELDEEKTILRIGDVAQFSDDGFSLATIAFQKIVKIDSAVAFEHLVDTASCHPGPLCRQPIWKSPARAPVPYRNWQLVRVALPPHESNNPIS